MLEKSEFEKNDFMWRVSTTVTVVAGLFSMLVAILLIVNYLQITAADPINDLRLTEMREEFAAMPERDEALAQRIRDLDLITRKAFFTSQAHLRTGGLLLLFGVVVFLVAFKNMARWKPEIPELSETPAAQTEWRSHAQSRTMIAWTSVVLLGVGLLASYLSETALEATPGGDADTEDAGGVEPPVVAVKEFPTWETMQLNWPTFRGPGAYGVAHFTNAPIDWDIETGKGIRWKTEVPLPGFSSPVVWDNRLFLSGADDKVREVYCYDTETGDLVWKRALEPFPGASGEMPNVTEETGYAASTMAAHGEQVFAIYANGDVVSYDFDGNLIWGRNLGLPDNHYGYSSSLLAFEGLLYVQYDQNEGGRLLALDVATGEDAWVKNRDRISWASPILAHTPFGVQVILSSEENVDAYDAASGKLLWSQDCLAGEVAPSPAYSDGIVFAANEFAMASAIRLSGSEGAVQSEILWEWDELLPEVASPVGDGERFYFVTTAGDLVSLDAKTGEEVWVEMVDYGFYSSPVLVGDRIYVIDTRGTMYIVRAAAKYELIASHAVGGQTFATPAFLDGRIYARIAEDLYCIE